MAGLYLLAFHRKDAAARLLGSWSLVNVVFFCGLFLKGGTLGDQYFYMLLVSMAATTGYCVALLARSLVQPVPRLIRASSIVTLVALASCVAYNARLYDIYDVHGVDNGCQQMAVYLNAHLPKGTPIDVDTSSYSALFPGYSIDLLRDPEQLQGQGVHYAVLSSKVSNFGAIPPATYRWVLANAVQVYAVDGDSFGQIALYYVA